jgi:hypothetical protein
MEKTLNYSNIDFDDEENKQELPFLFSPSLKYAFKITISFFILHKKSLESLVWFWRDRGYPCPCGVRDRQRVRAGADGISSSA